MQVNPIYTYIPQQPKQQPRKELDNKAKGIILASATAGSAIALAIMGKKQNLNIFKFEDFKKVDIGTKELLAIPLGSILGGLAGGIAVDKENKHAKTKEAIQQYAGNIIFPVAFVSGANAIYNKVSDKIKFPQTKNRFINAVTKAAPLSAITLCALTAGVMTGNKVITAINNKIHNENNDRKVKLTDFCAHVDDLLLGVTLVAQNLSKGNASPVGNIISRFIPAALVVPGYMTGTSTGEAKH